MNTASDFTSQKTTKAPRPKAWPLLYLVATGFLFLVASLEAKPIQVFDAQMAVGNPGLYPEFRYNVISIDTRPMCRSEARNPGGRDRYAGNAASYLEIGDAMAEAMLKLQQ